MPDPTPGTFRLFDHMGNVIAHGGTATEALAPLPDSTARKQLLAQLKQMQADAAAAQTLQARAHEAAVRAVCDGVLRLQHRLESFENKRAEQLRQRNAANREAEERAITDYLAQLSDPDNPASYGDEDELTTHAPSHLEDKEQLRAITAGDDDNQGDLPKDILERVPVDPGNYDFTAHSSPQVKQPISVSLNSEV
jgi:hypothetical protein